MNSPFLKDTKIVFIAYIMEINKQENENINSSNVIQAGRDVNISCGPSYNDVKEICHDVVREEINSASNFAIERFKSNIEAYAEQFMNKLKNEQNSMDLIQKFKIPELNFILHDSIRSYAYVEDKEQKEIIVETMIERLRKEETNVEKFIIDDVISVLPRLNKRLGLVLVAMFRRSVLNRSDSRTLEGILKNIPDKLDDITNITNLDISYLAQLGCINNLQGLKTYKEYEEILSTQYDLYFRKFPTYSQLRSTLTDSSKLWQPVVPLSNGYKAPIFIESNDDSVFSFFTNTTHFRDFVSNKVEQDYLTVFDDFVQSIPKMNSQEIKERLLLLNFKWKKLLDIFNNEKVKNSELSPVGRYIANTINARLFNTNKLQLADMY